MPAKSRLEAVPSNAQVASDSVMNLKATPYNPRKAWEEGQGEAFRRSLFEFGDLSGIVKNVRTGYLQREVSRAVRLRYTPKLRIVFDESVERGDRIDRLLREVLSCEQVIVVNNCAAALLLAAHLNSWGSGGFLGGAATQRRWLCRPSNFAIGLSGHHCPPTSTHGRPTKRPTKVRARCLGPSIQTPH